MKTEHIAALAVVAWIAYTVGKNRGNGPATLTDSNKITDTNQWWSYAGSWQS